MLTNNKNMSTIIFVDGSYFCFYRYHSLVNWWKHAYPDQLDVLENPYANQKFVDKFKKTFIDKLLNIRHALRLPEDTSIIIGKDCKRENIWRNKHFKEYKANRDEDGFMGGPFFKLAYDELFDQCGVTCVLKHSQLEADDCIAISTNYLLNRYKNINIYIITSDKDYLQLSEPRVHLYNLAFKKLTEQKSCSKNPKLDLFTKILTGDVSDNIPSVFPKCGPKTAIKYFDNPQLLTDKLAEKPEYKDAFERNALLVDFHNIPKELVDEFLTKSIRD